MSLSIIKKPGCSHDCSHCPMKPGDDGDGHDHSMPTQQIEGSLEGWRLAIAAGLVFLFPLGAGLAGAFFARPWGRNWQLGGFVAGVLVGIVIAKIISLFIKSNSDISECPHKDSQENSEK